MSERFKYHKRGLISKRKQKSARHLQWPRYKVEKRNVRWDRLTDVDVDGRWRVRDLVGVTLVGVTNSEKEKKKRHQTKVIEGTNCHDLRDGLGGCDGSLELTAHLRFGLRLKTRLLHRELSLQPNGGLPENLLARRLGCCLEVVADVVPVGEVEKGLLARRHG